MFEIWSIPSAKSDYCFTLIYYLKKPISLFLQLGIIYYFEKFDKNRHTQAHLI